MSNPATTFTVIGIGDGASAALGVGGAILIGTGLVLSLVVLVLYNKLVGARQRCRESFSGITTELQRRHDLIPNLVRIVKGYAKHEKELLERVTELRNQAADLTQRTMRRGASNDDFIATQHALASRERELAGALGSLIMQVEAYPDLKASQHYSQLMTDVRLTEDRIQAARRFYNANVREMNIRCEAFPSSLVARTFNFEQMNFFHLDDPLAAQRQQISF